jgi:hypothetical protein
MMELDRYGERGDAPAQSIIRANSHARAIRKAAVTQEELLRIKERVIRVQYITLLYDSKLHISEFYNVFFPFIRFKTLDTYDLSEKLSAGADKAAVDRITDDFIREQANLEFIDDMVSLF